MKEKYTHMVTRKQLHDNRGKLLTLFTKNRIKMEDVFVFGKIAGSFTSVAQAGLSSRSLSLLLKNNEMFENSKGRSIVCALETEMAVLFPGGTVKIYSLTDMRFQRSLRKFSHTSASVKGLVSEARTIDVLIREGGQIKKMRDEFMGLLQKLDPSVLAGPPTDFVDLNDIDKYIILNLSARVKLLYGDAVAYKNGDNACNLLKNNELFAKFMAYIAANRKEIKESLKDPSLVQGLCVDKISDYPWCKDRELRRDPTTLAEFLAIDKMRMEFKLKKSDVQERLSFALLSECKDGIFTYKRPGNDFSVPKAFALMHKAGPDPKSKDENGKKIGADNADNRGAVKSGFFEECEVGEEAEDVVNNGVSSGTAEWGQYGDELFDDPAEPPAVM